MFVLGYFNVNLLNYDNQSPTNELQKSLASNSFIPYIYNKLCSIITEEHS